MLFAVPRQVGLTSRRTRRKPPPLQPHPPMRKLIAASLLTVAIAAGTAEAQYMPVGPQQNVSLSTVLTGGWSQCYAAPMNVYIGDNAENVLNVCTAQYIMMAGRATGSQNFLLLAMGPLAAVTQNTGAGTSNTNLVNGSEWYFAPNWSWGFAGAGDATSQFQCDTQAGVDRMCLHTINNAGGYRIGNIQGLNNSTDYEKVFFQSAGVVATPEPASIVFMATGLVGIIAIRRRRNRQA